MKRLVHVAGSFARSLGVLIASTYTRVRIWRAPTVMIGGLPVADLTWKREATARDIASVQGALEVIERVAPRRLRRLRRDVRRILVEDGIGAPAAYVPAFGAITLEGQMLREQPPIAVATMLVHEATHARLRHWDAVRGAARRRVEAICYGQQLEFARALPDGDWLVRWSEESLERLGEPLDEEVRRRKLDHLRAIGLPSWAVKLVDLIMPDYS